MTEDTVIELAKQAKVKPLLYDGKWAVENLDVFAALVAAHEREACAKLCDAEARMWEHVDVTGRRYSEEAATAKTCAAAIRSRT